MRAFQSLIGSLTSRIARRKFAQVHDVQIKLERPNRKPIQTQPTMDRNGKPSYSFPSSTCLARTQSSVPIHAIQGTQNPNSLSLLLFHLLRPLDKRAPGPERWGVRAPDIKVPFAPPVCPLLFPGPQDQNGANLGETPSAKHFETSFLPSAKIPVDGKGIKLQRLTVSHVGKEPGMRPPNSLSSPFVNRR
jgi:hypothetical protein